MTYLLEVTDEQIAEAYKAVVAELRHPDAMREDDLVLIRRQLRVVDYTMLSTHWLQNKIVALRKTGVLPSSKKGNK